MKGTAISMKCRRRLERLAAFFGLALGLLLVISLEHLADIREDADPTMKVQVLEKDAFNEYGLRGETELSAEVIEEVDGVIRYSDRWLVRFDGTAEQSRYAEEMVSNMKTRYPSVRNIYVVPVPPRIVTEQGYGDELEKYRAYMEQLHEIFAKTAQVVDVLPALEEQAGQYLFFRTQDSWTARGALYGAGVLCEALGIEPFSREAYYEHMYREFYGNLYDEKQLTEEEQETFQGDPLFCYILPDARNREIVLDENGKEYRCPVFSPSTGGINCIVGDGQSVILEGDEQNEATKDEAIMLICDSNGRFLAPYLANYYETVYLVNVERYTVFYNDMPSILRTYGIKDIVLSQSAGRLGDNSYSDALNAFSDE